MGGKPGRDIRLRVLRQNDGSSAQGCLFLACEKKRSDGLEFPERSVLQKRGLVSLPRMVNTGLLVALSTAEGAEFSEAWDNGKVLSQGLGPQGFWKAF